MSKDDAQRIKSEAANLLWRVDEEAYRKVDKASTDKSYEEGFEMFRDELKKRGITYNPKETGEDYQEGRWIAKSEKGDAYEIADLSGNRDFGDATLTLVRISNYGG